MCPIIGYNRTNIVPIIGQISRVDLYVSQREDYNIFKLVFRWEVHIATKACLEQGISLLPVVMETIRGLHIVAKEHIQGIIAALTRYQGIGKHVVVIQLKKF